MTPPTILVTVSPTGAIQLETVGFAGPACQAASRALEAALGLTQSTVLTPAYFATEVTATSASLTTSPPPA
jgi:hypothetical protein